MGFLGAKYRKGWCDIDPQRSRSYFLTFRDSYVCANFGKNRSRNVTVRVLADGQTHTQTQTDFIICPMLYAIDMGQIKISKRELYVV